MDALACYASDSDSEASHPDGRCQGSTVLGKVRPREEGAESQSGRPSSQKVVKKARPGPHEAASGEATEAAPPVPDAILNLFPPAANTAEAHQGRTRGFPHVVGNFPTHVFVRVAVPAKCKPALEALLVRLARAMPGLQPTRPTTNDPSLKRIANNGDGWVNGEYHMSLSRTVAIRKHQQATLLRELRASLRRKVGSFNVPLERLSVFVNDDRSRTFLAIEPGNPGAGKLVGLIGRVDDAFALNDLQRFYADPKPHVSVAWVLGDREEELNALVAGLCPANGARGQGLGGQGCQWHFQVTDVECKVGNKIHSLVA
uniref:U6 snRNA phosphodiesterase 1 n=1 Tax=Pyramimonas obovata TaxID=1411642 RepID=A0A6T7VCR0_9CHLO|mmetsp:Transcript_17615/g.38428  ORF Transcript_17615/g.38428 Transcript_17615/m.38428 type:complete len:315 (+) Transcript_17615:86-1030(+)